MDALLAEIAGSEIATALRYSRWEYAAVNTAHVFGIALLVGAILPLDLRLLGLWRAIPHVALVRVLVPVAVVGLLLAVTAGALLFSVRAPEYAALTVFRVKLGLIATGVLSALAVHVAHGFSLESAGRARLAGAGAISITCWIGALIAGRMIAYAAD